MQQMGRLFQLFVKMEVFWLMEYADRLPISFVVKDITQED
jgi:hypothetical protein